jgi:rhodanese-related sulfurtransferase
MIEFIKRFLRIGPAVNYTELLNQGAIILDVRSTAEYASGHLKGSLNIPVDALASNLDKLKNKNIPIITCCASGMRSAAAKSILLNKGYSAVYNGGGWSVLKNKIQ